MCDPITLMMMASSASKLVMANEQKKAATVLGYDEASWDTD